MAKKDECSRCSKGRRTSHGGDLYCSHFGHSIQFDGISCLHFYSKIQRCPKCGQMVNIALATCPQCGHTLKQNTAHIDVQNTASKNISKNKTTKSTAKPVLIFLLIAAVVALIICLVYWNNQKNAEKEVSQNIQENKVEKVSTQATTDVPSYVMFGWNVIKRSYTDVESCSAYCVELAKKEMYDGELHTFYVVLYEVHATDLSLGAKCLSATFCPDYGFSGKTDFYFDGTLEENQQYILHGDIVKVNLK